MRLQFLCAFLAGGMMNMLPAWADGAPPQTASSSAANPVAVTPLDRLTATRERPLFMQDRRFPAEAPKAAFSAPPPAPPAAPPQVSLSGVIVDKKGPRALLRSDSSGKDVPVRLGDEIGGWRITEIEDQRVTMSLDERSVAISLFGGAHGGRQMPIVHQTNRVFEVNAAGVLRSHRVRRASDR